MRRLVSVLMSLVLAMPAVAASGLPGQASRYCTIPASVDIGGAAADDRSPYLGIFDGKWEGVLPATLIIYEVASGRAKGYYGWKDYRPWNVKAGCRPIQGRIVNGMLKFRGVDDIDLSAWGRRLKGTYFYMPGQPGGLVERSTFSRRR
jgi:hypothetical protein